MYANMIVLYFGKNTQIKMCVQFVVQVNGWTITTRERTFLKALHCFPLTPRLKHLYGCKHTAKEIRWHYTDQSNEEGVLRYPNSGKA